LSFQLVSRCPANSWSICSQRGSTKSALSRFLKPRPRSLSGSDTFFHPVCRMKTAARPSLCVLSGAKANGKPPTWTPTLDESTNSALASMLMPPTIVEVSECPRPLIAAAGRRVPSRCPKPSVVVSGSVTGTAAVASAAVAASDTSSDPRTVCRSAGSTTIEYDSPLTSPSDSCPHASR